MAERLDYIDKAKGLLIMLAVVGHIWQAGVVHNFIYAFHMPAFFVISGMLMRHTKSYEKTYSRFLIGRLYSFGVPFLFFEILGILTDILRHGVTLNIKGYVFNTISLPATGRKPVHTDADTGISLYFFLRGGILRQIMV